MHIPPSPHFTPLSLATVFNADRATLDGGLQPRTGSVSDWSLSQAFGERRFHGIPFALGEPDRPNVILLRESAAGGDVRIDVDPFHATYLVFLHAVEDEPVPEPVGFAPMGPAPLAGRNDGNELGRRVSGYILDYGDGEQVETPILRRFAIQQRHITWGPSPFAAIPARGPAVFTSGTEDFLLGRVASRPYGNTETRHDSCLAIDAENLWLYSLPNPEPEKPIHAIILRGGEERSIIYGISSTTLADHPLRPGVRRKLRLTLPEGAALNAVGELDADSRTPAIGIDLGTVISARAALDYDADRWASGEADVQPEPSTSAVIVEYDAHPAGRLYVATSPDSHLSIDLSEESGRAP